MLGNQIRLIDVPEENKPDDTSDTIDLDILHKIALEYQLSAGQIWRIGKHILSIGNCHDRILVSKSLEIIGREKADAIITDPPYMTTTVEFDKAINLKKTWGALLTEGKNTTEICAALNWGWCISILDYCHNNSYLALTSPVPLLALTQAIWVKRFEGVWVKQCPVIRTHTAKMPMGGFEAWCVLAHPLHKISDLVYNDIVSEGVPYRKTSKKRRSFRRGGNDSLDRSSGDTWSIEGYKVDNTGHRQATDVIYAHNKVGMSSAERTSHPTQKPVSLFATFIRWLTNEDALVMDPFAGSGTLMVASEIYNRKCISIELDINWAALLIQRMRNKFGLRAELVFQKDGTKVP